MLRVYDWCRALATSPPWGTAVREGRLGAHVEPISRVALADDNIALLDSDALHHVEDFVLLLCIQMLEEEIGLDSSPNHLHFFR